jgi:Asp-tRNA(Asn)/Glu-tRNA(Gln) amidotransferase A subunit family amidase
MGLCGHDAITLAGMLRRRQVSAREVVAAHIERAEAVDGAVNALVTPDCGQRTARRCSPGTCPSETRWW